MALKTIDLYLQLGDARHQIAELTEQVAALAPLRAENATLRIEISRLQARLPVTHEWHREVASNIFRCAKCGTRAYDTRAVLLDCIEAERARRRRQPGARTTTKEQSA